MHVPAFTSLLDGYYLQFNDTGPNGGSSTYVNRYTILFDVMVPGPLNWTPFFNANPYNANDADFYLAPDGSVGITAIYSATNVVAENAWHRIAFVADLANSTMAFYVNGTQVAAGTQVAQAWMGDGPYIQTWTLVPISSCSTNPRAPTPTSSTLAASPLSTAS